MRAPAQNAIRRLIRLISPVFGRRNAVLLVAAAALAWWLLLSSCSAQQVAGAVHKTAVPVAAGGSASVAVWSGLAPGAAGLAVGIAVLLLELILPGGAAVVTTQTTGAAGPWDTLTALVDRAPEIAVAAGALWLLAFFLPSPFSLLRRWRKSSRAKRRK